MVWSLPTVHSCPVGCRGGAVRGFFPQRGIAWRTDRDSRSQALPIRLETSSLSNKGKVPICPVLPHQNGLFRSLFRVTLVLRFPEPSQDRRERADVSWRAVARCFSCDAFRPTSIFLWRMNQERFVRPFLSFASSCTSTLQVSRRTARIYGCNSHHCFCTAPTRGLLKYTAHSCGITVSRRPVCRAILSPS